MKDREEYERAINVLRDSCMGVVSEAPYRMDNGRPYMHATLTHRTPTNKLCETIPFIAAVAVAADANMAVYSHRGTAEIVVHFSRELDDRDEVAA